MTGYFGRVLLCLCRCHAVARQIAIAVVVVALVSCMLGQGGIVKVVAHVSNSQFASFVGTLTVAAHVGN